MFKDGVTKDFKAFLLFPSKDEGGSLCENKTQQKEKKKGK